MLHNGFSGNKLYSHYLFKKKKSQEGEPRLFGHWQKISPYWVLYKTWTPVIFYICFPHLEKSNNVSESPTGSLV